jgi:hypothetical protein
LDYRWCRFPLLAGEIRRVAPPSQYRVVLLKAWTKDTLALKIERTLEPYAQDEIVSIQARVDFQFFVPWRRDWALLVLKSLEPVE